MPFWTRIVALLATLALVAVASGCGGGGDDEPAVPAGAIAVVGEREIPKADYDRLLAQAQTTYETHESGPAHGSA